MKHFFTLLSAIALTSAISVNAQNLHPLNQHGRSFEPKSLSEVTLPTSHKQSPRMAKSVIMKATEANNVITGPAMISYESSSTDEAGETIGMYFNYGIDIIDNGDGTLSIQNFGSWYSDNVKSLTIKYDAATGQFEIDNQVLFSSKPYGDASISAWDINEAGDDVVVDRSAKITGSIIDGSIVFDTPWGIFIDSGTYKDAYFDLAFYSEIIPATGDMTYTDSYGTSTTHITHVLANDSIYVLGFANLGEMIEMGFDYDAKTVSIPNQRALYAGPEYGVFYTYGLNRLMTSVESYDVPGTFTDNEITFGPWAALNNEGTGYLFKSSSIKLFEGHSLFNDLLNVNKTEASKEVARNKFYNVQGIETAQPQKGVNIQVTEYTDGSKKTVKILK